jgi:hypothetical protein
VGVTRYKIELRPAAARALHPTFGAPKGLRGRRHFRGSGCAVAAGAEHVVLYTDLANPTSNSIYQAIGFRPEHDAEERSFR